MKSEINERVAHYRKLNNLTQAQAAEIFGMKTSTYSQKERAGTISGDDILRFAEIFGVEPEVLLLGDEKVTEKKLSLIAKTAKNEIVLKTEEKTKPTPQAPIFVLSTQEKNHITILRSLTKNNREKILQYTYDVFKKKIKI